MQCSRCKAPVGLEQRFCSACGASLDETIVTSEESRGSRGSSGEAGPEASSGLGAASSSMLAASASAAWLSSSSSLDTGFAPGTMLLGRYRIVGLLGRGGMGEVYRADDLMLGQAVALKFLPAELASSPDRMARFYHEVRTARQISHPNVCRVYDIGDLGGRPFLSMELVDGEDLSGLLRRIGRLPKDKASELGRQMCAGLAAIHNAGVLHRDLKPANVMIDSQGKVRLTDFGLAVVGERANLEQGRAGTPAYMSPEQLEGKELAVQSDLYSLGLVLYEMTTGRRPYNASSIAELSQRQSEPPLSPSSLVQEIDPALERSILRCLEHDPHSRPKSAIAVAASLPGGNPLAAALEAGETPSPEMVAEAGEEGRLPARLAWSYMAVLCVAVALSVWIAERFFLVNRVPLPRPPAVLEDRATQIIDRFGYTEKPADWATGLFDNMEYLRFVEESDSSTSRWDRLASGQPPGIVFWFRQSPQHMHPMDAFFNWDVSLDDPPHQVPGMIKAMLNPNGNLLYFSAVPVQVDSALEFYEGLEDRLFFETTGLDPQRFEETAPVWVPTVYCDVRRAWVGTHEARPDIPLRLESASFAGRPVYVEVIGPWTKPSRLHSQPKSTGQKIAGSVSALLVIALLLGSVLVARQHLRHGRGDRRGASRLAFFIFASYLFIWIYHANHASSLPEEMGLFIPALGLAVFLSSLFWIIYFALEPFMRRHWPDLIISWTRLLSGRFRDPLVGKDLLIGILFGALLALMESLEHFVPQLLGRSTGIPERTQLFATEGFLNPMVDTLHALIDAIFSPLAIVFLLLGLRNLLRRKWLAVAVMVVVFGVMIGIAEGQHGPVLGIALGMFMVGIWMFIALRFGLLALMMAEFTTRLLTAFPITTELSRWYAPAGVVPVVTILVLAAYGMQTAVSGKPLFKRL